jgi:general secretion pathway protein H
MKTRATRWEALPLTPARSPRIGGGSARTRAGMTLIEIMVAVIIVAFVSTGVTYGLGLMMRTSLRSACLKIIAASRYAYTRSVTQGATVRVVLDLDEARLAIEEAHGRVALTRATDPTSAAMAGGDDEGSGDDRTGIDPWAAAEAALQRTQHPTFGASPFSTISDEDGDPIERYAPHSVGSGIRFVKMLVPHEPDPREHGRGAIYFFPGGRTEHAVIQLTDARDDVYTVEIHPLTGRGTVHTEAWEPREVEDDGAEQSEVDE